MTLGYEFDPWPARFVLHDYARLRPAQQRGIPEFGPALDLFEEARRFRRAVLASAETVADHAGFIYTDAAADGDGAEPDTGFGTAQDYVNVKRRMMGVLPAGWKAAQMKAEQPTTTYEPYVLMLLMEAAQVLDMPLFIMTGDARLANMSSAYVATQSFIKSVTTDREEYEAIADQIWDEWLPEARRIPGLIPRDIPDDPDHSWRWPRVASHADPGKMALAQNQRIKNGTRSPSIECADDGLDFEEIAERSAKDFGVTVPVWKAAYFQSMFAEKGTPPPASLTDDGEEEDDESTQPVGGDQAVPTDDEDQ